jgi:hypothetical protein
MGGMMPDNFTPGNAILRQIPALGIVQVCRFHGIMLTIDTDLASSLFMQQLS